jgi:hypothetical protein
MNETGLEGTAIEDSGWKPIPLPLKVIFIVFVLWMVGAVMNLPNLIENGMPIYGTFVYGTSAAIFPLLVDFIGPAIFLFALWNRRPWAALWAFAYNGIFILNNTVALFTVREDLGVPQILVPTIASVIFLAVIFWKRDYFEQTSNL